MPAFTFVHHAGLGLERSKLSCFVSYIMSHSTTTSSLISFLLIAVERATAICHPLSYHCIFTPRATTILLGIIWIYAWTLISTMWVLTNKWPPDGKVCYLASVSSKEYTAVMCVHILIVFVLSIIINGAAAYSAWKHRYKIRIKAQIMGANTRVQQDAKCARTLMIILAAFYICRTPYFLLLPFAQYDTNIPYQWIIVTEQVLNIAFAVHLFLNPCIYIWKDSAMRRAFRQMLSRNSGYQSVLDLGDMAAHCRENNVQSVKTFKMTTVL